MASPHWINGLNWATVKLLEVAGAVLCFFALLSGLGLTRNAEASLRTQLMLCLGGIVLFGVGVWIEYRHQENSNG